MLVSVCPALLISRSIPLIRITVAYGSSYIYWRIHRQIHRQNAVIAQLRLDSNHV